MLSYHEQVFWRGNAPTSNAAAAGGAAASGVTADGGAAERGGERRGAESKKSTAAAKKKGAPRGGYGEALDRLAAGRAEGDAWRLREAHGESLGAVRQAHGLATALMPSIAPLLPASLDDEARGSQLAVACSSWQELRGGEAGAGVGGTSAGTRELFHEENSAEVARLLPTLESLTARARELLEQWPEHAGLQLLVQVCERLRGFRVGSPLMKFVIGTELLLRQAWEWEGVACRATSIKEHIDALTALVLRWRKMELHAWPKLLACTAQQQHEKALVAVWVRLFRAGLPVCYCLLRSVTACHCVSHRCASSASSTRTCGATPRERRPPTPTRAARAQTRLPLRR